MQGYIHSTVHATLTFFKVLKGHFVLLYLYHTYIHILIHTTAIYKHTHSIMIYASNICVCNICGLCIVHVHKQIFWTDLCKPLNFPSFKG